MSKGSSILAAVLFSGGIVTSYATSTLSNNDIADLLGWVKTDKPCDRLCGGYFKQPQFVLDTPHPGKIANNSTRVTADGPTKFVENGASILQKNVVVTQPGRIIRADKAIIKRNAKTGRITTIELKGHVSLQQKDKLIIGKTATINLNTGSAKITGGIYHVYYLSKQHHATISAWGRAAYVHREPSGILKLYKNVSYSTCAPVDPAWQIKASRMTLNKKAGIGKARDVVIKWHGIPLLWSPYYSFPLDNRRKSGLLSPTMGYSGKDGADISIPFYWNMAPNYDDTITPRYISKRGFQLNNLFRFMSEQSLGKIFLSFLPKDSLFRDFKQHILNTTANTPSNAPYLKALEHVSTNRWMLRAQDHTQLSPRWSASFNVNKVSDDYYLTDFNMTLNGIIANQLLNQADIRYHGDHWNFTGLVQGYQTLHPINQAATQDQYQRLPEFTYNGNYPQLGKHLQFSMQSSIVNFDYHSQFNPNMPIGQRLHLRPGISIPFNFASSYITPSVYIDNTDYLIHNPLAYQDSHISRTLPIIDIDSGLYFNRNMQFNGHDYTQTLQPHLFYLYVPYNNQDATPDFDTYLLPFNYNQLFSLNRFTGPDRLQNANQLSLGVTSRILDSNTGAEKLQFDLGAIYYINKPKVCLQPGCTTSRSDISPIVGDATMYPAAHWSTTLSWAWDPNVDQTNNMSLNLNYHRDDQHIFSIGYQLVNENDSPQYSDVTLGYFWPLGHRWSALGYTYYNIQQHRPDSYYVGFQYSTCCWAIRLITQKQFSGIDTQSSHNQYQTGYYVQLLLKGLGAVGNRNTDALLTSTLPGYNPLMQ